MPLLPRLQARSPLQLSRQTARGRRCRCRCRCRRQCGRCCRCVQVPALLLPGLHRASLLRVLLLPPFRPFPSLDVLRVHGRVRLRRVQEERNIPGRPHRSEAAPSLCRLATGSCRGGCRCRCRRWCRLFFFLLLFCCCCQLVVWRCRHPHRRRPRRSVRSSITSRCSSSEAFSRQRQRRRRRRRRRRWDG